MARGINKVILVGNLGKDPEVRYSAAGAAIANLTVATTEAWKDRQTGEKQEKTEWHRVSMFGKLAEIAGEYLRKGQQVYIEGRLQTRKWQDQSGQDRYTTEIVASDMQMLGGRSGGGGSADFNQDSDFNQNAGYGQSAPSQSRAQPQGGGSAAPAGGGFDDFDDDIPF